MKACNADICGNCGYEVRHVGDSPASGIAAERDELRALVAEYEREEEAEDRFSRAQRDSVNAMMREALGSKMYSRLWGPELERLGKVCDALWEERDELRRERDEAWCMKTVAVRAVRGACPEHGGDACLATPVGLQDALRRTCRERDELFTGLGDWKTMHERRVAERDALQARVARLEAALRWALRQFYSTPAYPKEWHDALAEALAALDAEPKEG